MTPEQPDVIYVCKSCLRIADAPDTCHGAAMLECHCGEGDDDQRKPITTADGRLLTHAPRWWAERVLNTITKHEE